MKKKLFQFVLVCTVTGLIAAGCSSQKTAGNKDSTSTDTVKNKTTVVDTVKKDTTKH